MKVLKILGIGLAVGFVLGWIWGFLEGAGHLLVHLLADILEAGSLPPISLTDFLAVPLMAAALYACILAVISFVLTPAGCAVLRLLPERFTFSKTWETSLAVSLAAVIFFNLYWWTRPILFYGLRFYDPRRLAASAIFAVIAIVLSVLIVLGVRRFAGSPTRYPGRWTIAVLVALCGSGIAIVREATLSKPQQPDQRDWVNVVLVVPDALRADHLGCYGYAPYDRPVSPFIDRLAAEEAVCFESAVTQAPYTWTSFGSFLTGKYPRKHGLLRMDPTQRLDPQDNVTMAEILDNAGYNCAAFLMGTLSNNSGLLQGFDRYFEAIVGHDPVSIHSKWSIFKSDLVLMRLYNKIKQARDPALVNTLACDFIRSAKHGPFFLMVHYYATHTPYDPPEPYKSMYDSDYEGPFETFTQGHNFAVMDGRLSVTDRDLKRIKALYDGGVTFTDKMFNDLYDTLTAAGVLARTLVIFFSDHGEELYDHAVFEHDWMYNTNQLVPLIVRFPGGAFGGRRVTRQVSLIDLLPTVLEITGVQVPEDVAAQIDGQSLTRHLEGGAPAGDQPIYTFCENNRYLSVQDGEFKLIRYRWTDRDEPDRLYHIAADPGETENALEDHPEAFARLDEVLRKFDESMPKKFKTYESDPELHERLFQLGYIQGNVPLLEGEIEKKNK
jgi:arylsulfatase A-like enzyme